MTRSKYSKGYFQTCVKCLKETYILGIFSVVKIFEKYKKSFNI